MPATSVWSSSGFNTGDTPVEYNATAASPLGFDTPSAQRWTTQFAYGELAPRRSSSPEASGRIETRVDRWFPMLGASETHEVTYTPFEQEAPAVLASAEPGFCTNRTPFIPGFPFPAAAGQIPLESGQQRREREEGPGMVASVVQRPPLRRDEHGGGATGRHPERGFRALPKRWPDRRQAINTGGKNHESDVSRHCRRRR